jgi:hypothetical protein
LIKACWIVRDATSPLRELIELVSAGLGLRRFGVAEETHPVNNGLAPLGLLLDLLHRHGAGVVVPVGDHQQDLAISCGVLPQVGLSHVHRVSQGRSADGIDSSDSGLEDTRVTRQRDVDSRLVGKIEHEHLVLGIGRADECERRRFDPGPQCAHAAAVVDQQTQRYGNVIPAKQGDRLPFPVLVNAERASIEIRHQFAAVVLDHRLEGHEPGLRAKRWRLLS